METLDTVNKRLLKLVTDYGGPSKMAEDLGLATPQIFYNLKGRPDSKPNSETIEKVFSLIPSANANWLYKGVGPIYLVERSASDEEQPGERAHEEVSSVEAENARLRLEIEFLRRERDQYKSEKSNYWTLLENMYNKKQDFSTVSSQTTDTLFMFNKVPSFVDPKFSDFKVRNAKKIVCAPWALPGVTDIKGAIKE